MSAPGPIFRRAGRQDLPAAYWRAFEAIAADARNLLVVAELDRRVVGTLQLTFIPSLTFVGGERAQIEAVHVDGRHRGRGLGGAMLRWAIERARERGCRLVQLTTVSSGVELADPAVVVARRSRAARPLPAPPTDQPRRAGGAPLGAAPGRADLRRVQGGRARRLQQGVGRPRSSRTITAALRPGPADTEPPGWVVAPVW